MSAPGARCSPRPRASRRQIEFAACVGRNPERLSAFSRDTGIPARDIDAVLADKSIASCRAGAAERDASRIRSPRRGRRQAHLYREADRQHDGGRARHCRAGKGARRAHRGRPLRAPADRRARHPRRNRCGQARQSQPDRGQFLQRPRPAHHPAGLALVFGKRAGRLAEPDRRAPVRYSALSRRRHRGGERERRPPFAGRRRGRGPVDRRRALCRRQARHRDLELDQPRHVQRARDRRRRADGLRHRPDALGEPGKAARKRNALYAGTRQGPSRAAGAAGAARQYVSRRARALCRQHRREQAVRTVGAERLPGRGRGLCRAEIGAGQQPQGRIERDHRRRAGACRREQPAARCRWAHDRWTA